MAERDKRATAAPRYLAVVRPGETEVYRMLKEYLGSRGLVEVVWDRRGGERRRPTARSAAAAERRGGDRRSAPRDASYRTLGFFLARPARERR